MIVKKTAVSKSMNPDSGNKRISPKTVKNKWEKHWNLQENIGNQWSMNTVLRLFPIISCAKGQKVSRRSLETSGPEY